MKQSLLVIVGAAVGGILGYMAFHWITGQGFYGLILPGGLLGIGAGLARNKSLGLAVACGIAALALGIFTEWTFRPFIKDESFGYFLTHVFDLRPLTLIMIAVGGAVGFWIPFRQIPNSSRQNSPGQNEV
jgi:F0F1-type ATP synthase assembly protein I